MSLAVVISKAMELLSSQRKSHTLAFYRTPIGPITFRRMSYLLDCRFVRDKDPEVKAGTEEGREKMRSLSERALSAGGLHVAQGAQLWNLYRCALRLAPNPIHPTVLLA